MNQAAPDMSVGGDNDRWMLLERTSAEDFPLMVRARINAEISAFIEDSALSAICFWAQSDGLVNDFGFPHALSELQALEDVAVEQLAGAGVAAFHTGSVTGEGQRVLYFAHARDVALPLDVEALSLAGFETRLLQVENRAAYFDLLTPTQLDAKLNGDQGVISNLASHGDDGSVPRKTDFWFYGERASLERLVSELEHSGYALDHWTNEPIGVVLTKITAVDFGAFREISPYLLSVAGRHAVEYDGWETFVVKPGMPEPAIIPADKPKSLLSKLFGVKKN